jgi:hypothetical protein
MLEGEREGTAVGLEVVQFAKFQKIEIITT